MVKLGRPRSHGYEEFGFTLMKQNNKYVAICVICNRTLQNTAFTRLKGHRNICKQSPADIPLCSMFVPGEDNLCLPNPNEFIAPDGGSQISCDGLAMILPDSGDGKINLPSYYNAGEVTHLQDRQNRTNLKKVAVLKIIEENKNSLFENPMADETEVWIKVLRKAQSLGLAPEDSHWTFARDSLYRMWKNQTLAKREYLESDGWNDKLDIVDLAILRILNKNPPVSSTIDLSDDNSDCSLAENQKNEEVFESIPTQERSDKQISNEDVKTKTNNEKRKADEMHEAELKIKRLKAELLEIEVYKQRLQVLLLERQLKIPPSKCTAKLFPELQIVPTENSLEEGEQEDSMTIKSELKDHD